MPSPPNTFALEAAVRALSRLSWRSPGSWLSSDFESLLPDGRRGAELLVVLERADLIVRDGSEWTMTAHGRSTIAAASKGQWNAFALAVLETGLYDDQLSRLLESGDVEGAVLRCPVARVRHVAPVAGAVLAWVPAYRDANDLVIPLADLEHLLAETSMDQAVVVPDWVVDNTSVGWRAELYSLRSERTIHGVAKVLHTSKDAGDGFGYDIEVTTASPSRIIEVKGSRSDRVSFTMTRRELETARAQPDRYQLQFWGEISLARKPRDEYRLLRSVGYPRVYGDVAAKIDSGEWSSEATSWKIETSG